jgi:hypothetical protein
LNEVKTQLQHINACSSKQECRVRTSIIGLGEAPRSMCRLYMQSGWRSCVKSSCSMSAETPALAHCCCPFINHHPLLLSKWQTLCCLVCSRVSLSLHSQRGQQLAAVAASNMSDQKLPAMAICNERNTTPHGMFASCPSKLYWVATAQP